MGRQRADRAYRARHRLLRAQPQSGAHPRCHPDSEPNLEIENGNIIGAGHASSVGRFDDEELFYLESRGISENEARKLVVRGFFGELVEEIGIPAISEHLMNVIDKRWPAAKATRSHRYWKRNNRQEKPCQPLIKDLYAHVETKDGIKPILKGVNLTVNSGETHAIMGPNGSGKSTLAYTLAGHPKYIVDSGQVLLDGENILKMTPDERAKAGIFLAMQYPVEVPGVSMTNFLRTAKTEVDGKAPAIRTWTKELSEAMKRLKMDPKFATRSVNEGFSGGEKKRAEVLQLELLKPKFAILDETDSGLDVDALRIVSEGVNRAKEANQFGILMVTHYTRILRYIKPDIVHVFADGHFIKTGGPELADELEETGYDAYLPEGSDSESALA